MDPASSLLLFSTRDLAAALPSIASLSGLYHDAFSCLAPYLDFASLASVHRCCRSLQERIAAAAPLGRCHGSFAPRDARCFPPLSSALRLCITRFECAGSLGESCGSHPLAQRLPHLTHLCFRLDSAAGSGHAIQLAVLLHQASQPPAVAFSQWPPRLSSLEFRWIDAPPAHVAQPYEPMLSFARLIPGLRSLSLVGPWPPCPVGFGRFLDALSGLTQLRQLILVREPVAACSTAFLSQADLHTILSLPSLTSLELQRGNLASNVLQLLMERADVQQRLRHLLVDPKLMLDSEARALWLQLLDHCPQLFNSVRPVH